MPELKLLSPSRIVAAFRLCVALVVVAAPVALVSRAHAEPTLTEATPPDGQALDAPPDLYHLCFSEPVQMEDPSQWIFDIRAPDGRAPGGRTEFSPDGACVDLYVGLLPDVPPGVWTLSWTVHAQSDGSEGSGVLHAQVAGDFGLTPAPGQSSSSDDGSDDNTALFVAVGVGLALGLLVAAIVIILVRRRAAK